MTSPQLTTDLDSYRGYFNQRPYWNVFSRNIVGTPVAESKSGDICVFGDYKDNSNIELRLVYGSDSPGPYQLPKGAQVGMLISRKGTEKLGIISHTIGRSPRDTTEAMHSVMLERHKKTTRGCLFDSELRRITNELYGQFKRRWQSR